MPRGRLTHTRTRTRTRTSFTLRILPPHPCRPASLDCLPCDLAQLLLDRVIEMGTLTEAHLPLFASRYGVLELHLGGPRGYPGVTGEFLKLCMAGAGVQMRDRGYIHASLVHILPATVYPLLSPLSPSPLTL